MIPSFVPMKMLKQKKQSDTTHPSIHPFIDWLIHLTKATHSLIHSFIHSFNQRNLLLMWKIQRHGATPQRTPPRLISSYVALTPPWWCLLSHLIFISRQHTSSPLDSKTQYETQQIWQWRFPFYSYLPPALQRPRHRLKLSRRLTHTLFLVGSTERNICILLLKHSSSYVSKWLCMLWKHSYVFFFVKF